MRKFLIGLLPALAIGSAPAPTVEVSASSVPSADEKDSASCRDPSSGISSPQLLAEPVGSLPVTSLAFASPLDFEPEDGWDISIDRSGFGIFVDSTAPASPPFVAQATYPPGFGDGRSPVWAERDISTREFSRLYVCVWFKLSGNWQGHGSGVNKIGYVWTNGKPVVAIVAMGSGGGELEPQLRLQDLPSTGSSGARARNLRPNVGSSLVERGKWHRWEVLLVANEPGATNGEGHWWIDGVKVGEHRDIRFMGPAQDPFWERVSWRPIWGGRGDAIRETQRMWLDHYYVSGSP